MAGILIQHLTHLPFLFAAVLTGIGIIGSIVISRLSLFERWSYSWLKTVFIGIALCAMGMVLYCINNVRFSKNWFGKNYTGKEILLVALSEKPVEKDNSYKATAVVQKIISNNKTRKTTGKIIIYFKQEESVLLLQPGYKIAFKKPISEIKNSGNPGNFDYKQYALFNKITHTVYLTEQQYVLIAKDQPVLVKRILLTIRTYVLNTIKKYISGKKEQGLAEALLIGYKDDLDRELLQSYTNTGVVHVIAVSGMHLALIFWILNILLKPLLHKKKLAWLHPLTIISILWLFSLLAGGEASIVRAAVMFTFILLGNLFNKKAAVYNTLSASAFVLLCYNPYWLWDVGFQLSYAAVLSIVIFYKPIYNLFFFKNELLNQIWKLLAVSTAAQILTTPISLYHFHQFPVYFLITNLLVVPVSSLALMLELLLVILSPVTAVAQLVGKLITFLIWWMNTFIEQLERFPLSIWYGIQINQLQVVLLFIAIAGIGIWLIQKRKVGFWLGSISILIFIVIRAVSFHRSNHQQKIIVYNISKHDAVDFVNGRYYHFLADSLLVQQKKIINMNVMPARTLYRIQKVDTLPGLAIKNNTINFLNKKILVVNTAIAKQTDSIPETPVDIVLLCGNPKLYISNLLKLVKPGQVIISGSVPVWKANYWQHDCDSLGVPCYNVVEKGAFVMNLR